MSTNYFAILAERNEFKILAEIIHEVPEFCCGIATISQFESCEADKIICKVWYLQCLFFLKLVNDVVFAFLKYCRNERNFKVMCLNIGALMNIKVYYCTMLLCILAVFSRNSSRLEHEKRPFPLTRYTSPHFYYAYSHLTFQIVLISWFLRKWSRRWWNVRLLELTDSILFKYYM